MNTKVIGDIGEKIARDVYDEKGYKILETNAKYCDCEVDLICECFVDENGNLIRSKDNNSISKFFEKLGIKRQKSEKNQGERTIVFCEVKTRYGEDMGAPEEAVTPYKVGRYVTAAKTYISRHRLANADVRFDIFTVGEQGYNLIENAFTENDAKYKRR